MRAPPVSCNSVLYRLMSPSDVPALVTLDSKRVPPGDQWPSGHFLKTTRRNDRLGLCFYTSEGTPPAGYMVLCFRPHDVAITRILLPECPESEVLRPLIYEWAYRQAMDFKRPYLTTWIRESDLKTSLFLKEIGFVCTRIYRSWYKDPGEDCLLFKKSAYIGV